MTYIQINTKVDVIDDASIVVMSARTTLSELSAGGTSGYPSGLGAKSQTCLPLQRTTSVGYPTVIEARQQLAMVLR